MTDSWSIPKPLGYVAAFAAAIVSVGGAWKLLDLPVPASRAWVMETVSPFHTDSIELLRVRRRLYVAELYSYEAKAVADPTDHLNIERIKGEIAEIDRQIAARR